MSTSIHVISIYRIGSKIQVDCGLFDKLDQPRTGINNSSILIFRSILVSLHHGTDTKVASDFAVIPFGMVSIMINHVIVWKIG